MMTDFTNALKEKIEVLRTELEELNKNRGRIYSKLEVLEELLSEEEGLPKPETTTKKRGRPRVSKAKSTAKKKKQSTVALDDELYKEALKNLGADGTTPEMQEKLAKRFNPQPRPSREYGPGITAGDKSSVDKARGTHRSDAQISIEDDNE